MKLQYRSNKRFETPEINSNLKHSQQESHYQPERYRVGRLLAETTIYDKNVM